MDWIKLTPETRPGIDEMVLCVCNLRSSPYYHEVYYGKVIANSFTMTGFLMDVTHFCRIELPEDSDDFEKEESRT